MIRWSGCWAKVVAVASTQTVDVDAFGVEAGQQCDRLDAEGVFDRGGVSQLRQPQLLLDRGRERGQAALASGAAQGGDDLGLGQPRRLGRGGGDGQHRTGFGCGDSAGALSEGVQETWEVLPQQRPQFVAGPGAPPGGVLVGAGEHGDRLRQFGVGG